MAWFCNRSLILGINKNHNFDSLIQLQHKLSHFTYLNFLKINKKNHRFDSLVQLQHKLSHFTYLKMVSFPGLTPLQSLHLPEVNACTFKTLILIMSMISSFHSLAACFLSCYGMSWLWNGCVYGAGFSVLFELDGTELHVIVNFLFFFSYPFNL